MSKGGVEERGPNSDPSSANNVLASKHDRFNVTGLLTVNMHSSIQVPFGDTATDPITIISMLTLCSSPTGVL